MLIVEPMPGSPSDILAAVSAQGRLNQSVSTTLLVIAAARAERETPPIHAARRRLAVVYGAKRLRRRLERDSVAS